LNINQPFGDIDNFVSSITAGSGITLTPNPIVSTGTITNNLITGITGGQTAIGGTAVTDILKLQGTTGNGTLTSPAIQLLTGNNGATVAVTVLNNGNVGIGTTAPSTTLHINNSTAGAENLLRLQNSAQSWYQVVGNGSNFASGYLVFTQGTPSSTNWEAKFIGGGVLNIKTSISSPIFASNITGRGDSSILSWTNAGGNFNGTLTVGQDYPNGVSNTELIVGSATGSYVRVRNNAGTEFFRVTDTGNVGIGTTAPASLFSIGSGTLAGGDFQIATGGKVVDYGGVVTTGYGVPAIYGSDRKTGLTAAQALATFTVGAADGSFLVSANILVTTATLHNFTVTVSYTDEGNTARVLTLQFSTLAGALLINIINTASTVPYEGVPLHIRAKASTTIIIATTGTFTTCVYNFEEMISQIK
jgi:hypothetical protein